MPTEGIRSGAYLQADCSGPLRNQTAVTCRRKRPSVCAIAGQDLWAPAPERQRHL